MAEYEDYTTTSKVYDECRRPVGLEPILGALPIGVGKEPKDVHLVDIGCGTGNYVVALSPFVGRVTGVEFNKGMLEQAQKKTVGLSNVEVRQGDATQLDLPDGFCDAVIINQVLHHVSDIGKVIKECYRILRPRGALIVNTASPEQMVEPMWFQYLIPAACERLKTCNRAPSLDAFCKLMEDVGFQVKSQLALTYELHMGEAFFDKEGPFSETWRMYDSTWAMATKEELEVGLARWRKIIDEGKADEFIAEKDQIRKNIGLTTTVIAYKGLS